MTQVVALDTETPLIGPGSIVPKLICLSAATVDPDTGEIESTFFGNSQLDEIEDFLLDLFTDDGIRLVFHNAGFDLAVIVNALPTLLPLVFEKLFKGLVTDTAEREKLLNLSSHGKITEIYAPDGSKMRIRYRLEDLVMKYMGLDRSADKQGDDIWRLNYEALDGYHADQYPLEAAKYAQQDATDTLAVHDLQAEAVLNERGPSSVKTAEFQTAVKFALQLQTAWGLRIDQEQVARVQAMVEEELAPEKLNLLIEASILTPAQPPRPYANSAKNPDGSLKMRAATKASIKTKLLKAQVEKVCKQHTIEIKKTAPSKKFPQGTTSTDHEVIAGLADLCPILAQYQHRQKLQKLVSTYLPHLQGAKTLHPDYDVLKETGRTSSFASDKYPSSNIQQEDPRTRPCFIPRKGKVFCAADYSGIELVSFGQTTYSLFGYSVHRDLNLQGVDLHAYLGAQIALRKSPEFKASGSPMDVYHAFKECEHGELAAVYKHFRKLAKPVGLGLPGGMGPDTLSATARRDYGVHFSPVEAEEMVQIWRETYPEANDYFNWIKRECRDPNNVGAIKFGEPEPLYQYFSPLGMYRAGCTYCAAANGAALQTRTAEGAKMAVFNVSRECYDWTLQSPLLGCRPVIFLHDEQILEIPDDDRKEERAQRLSQVMVESMQRVMPDMKIKADPLLMDRWWKQAEPVYDANGRLVIWRPGVAAA